MLKSIALSLIRAYQKWLSPKKGFSCAYRVHTGHASCSTFGFAAIEKHGILLGLRLIRHRLDKCSWVHHQHHQPVFQPSLNRRLQGQGGFVDLACDPGGCDIPCDVGHCHSCDVPGDAMADCAGNACSALSCGPGDADYCCGSGHTREAVRRRGREARRQEGAGKEAAAGSEDSSDE